MKINVKVHTYLVTDNGTCSIVPANCKLTSEQIKEARKNHDSVFYAGLREFEAEISGPAIDV